MKHSSQDAPHKPTQTEPPADAHSIREWLALDEPARERWRERLDKTDKDRLFRHWSFWARPDQIIPPGDWVYWLILAGRGAGKTRAGAEALREWSKAYSST
jgi:hypothetical protein